MATAVKSAQPGVVFTGTYLVGHFDPAVIGPSRPDGPVSVLTALATPPATAATAEAHAKAAQTALGKAGAVKPPQ